VRILKAAFLALAIAAAPPAQAVQPDEILADPALEARARALSVELRCLVCQNQSIDDSNAQLARELRLLLRERLVAGDTDEQVLDFLVARYGQFVLLKPQFNATTALLWIAPPLIVIGGGVLAFRVVRRRATAPAAAALTAEEERRLRALVREGETQPKKPGGA
jgi:cytochrome c-type biogenesis protein CcmH